MNHQRQTFLLAISAHLLGASTAAASEPTLTTVSVASGLTKPLFVTHAPGDYQRLFIVEENGKVKILKNGTVLSTPFIDVQSLMGGSETYLEYGLLGMAFHPNYASNGTFYLYYTAGNSNLAQPVIISCRVSADPDVADFSSRTTILTFTYTLKQHRAGWMDFGRDGYLYIATGDGGENDPSNAGADLTVLKGKILRLDVDGPDNIPGNADDDAFPADPNKNYVIPADNPFLATPGAAAEICHYGLRNPWRCCFDRATGELYIGDVGQVQREEVSFAANGTLGLFYGWRCWEGTLSTGLSCGSPPTAPTPPIHDYPRTVGISIIGGYVYRGCAIPELGGTYIFGDWTNKFYSFRYTIGGGLTNYTDRTAALNAGTGTLSSFGEDAYGELYICRITSGEIRKIVAASPQGPDCNANSKRDNCDIADGSSPDINANLVPDECECVTCLGDANGNNQIDGDDIQPFANCLLTGSIATPGCRCADLSNDNALSAADISPMIDKLIGTSDPNPLCP